MEEVEAMVGEMQVGIEVKAEGVWGQETCAKEMRRT